MMTDKDDTHSSGTGRGDDERNYIDIKETLQRKSAEENCPRVLGYSDYRARKRHDGSCCGNVEKMGNTIYRFVENFIEENHMVPPGGWVLRGPPEAENSLAMLDMLTFSEKKEFYASGSSYSSSDQGERSGQDCVFVEEMCRKWEVPCRIYTYPVPALSKKWKVRRRRDTSCGGTTIKKRLGLSDKNTKIALCPQ